MGTTAALLVKNWVEQQRPVVATGAPAAPQTPSRKVVVATQPLRFGNEITAINVKEEDWPAAAIPPGAFTDKAVLLKGDKRQVLGAIEVGEPILPKKITGPGQRATLSARLERGKNAVTIRVNDVVGVAGFVLPDERVDVLLTRNDDKTSYTDLLLQNLRVLAVDQLADERSEKPSVVKAVTMEVTTDEAQKLALASAIGTLSLALRPAGMTAGTEARRISVADLGFQAPPPPVQLVDAPAPVPVFRASPRLAVIGVTRAMERKEYNVKSEGRGSVAD